MLLTFLHIIPSLFSAPDDLSVSDDMEKGVINSIKIEGVKGKGDYNLSTKEWSVSSSSAASYNVPISAGLTVGTETVNLAPNATLMMIPQTLGDDAKITINFTPTGKSAVDLTFDLKDTKWVAGNHVTYLLSTTKIITLNMGSVTYPQWQTVEGSAFTSEKLKDSYANDDALGMYVVDKNNKVIEENLKFTYKDGKWIVGPEKKFKGSPQYNYFVYYPYQKGGLPGAPAKDASNIDVTSAASFFDKAIKVWCNKFDTSRGQTIDQSDIAKMNSFDLQIGKADVLGESGTTINFRSMKHAMGLAEIVLGKTSFTNSICYLVGYKDYPTWKGTATFYASSSIKNHTMYGIADHRYVSIVKPGENSFMSNTDKDAWKEEVKLSPAANEVKSGTAYSSINPTPPYPYTLAVGDIYYSDGAISHQEDDLLKSTPKRIPIGIVGYTTMKKGDGNYWTEKDTKEKGIGGHALVMCLKHIGSTKTSDFGYSYKWCTFDGQTSHRKLSMPEILNSFEKDYGSGYLMTKDFWLSSSYPAFQAVKNYNEGKIANAYTYPKDKCTGWFIPTVGQFYAVLSQLGQYSGTFTWGVDLGSDSRDKINAALMKVGLDNYTEFFQSPARDNQVCTTTEIKTVSMLVFSFEIYSGSEPIFSFGTLSGSTRYLVPSKVRPFLAF